MSVPIISIYYVGLFYIFCFGFFFCNSKSIQIDYYSFSISAHNLIQLLFWPGHTHTNTHTHSTIRTSQNVFPLSVVGIFREFFGLQIFVLFFGGRFVCLCIGCFVSYFFCKRAYVQVSLSYRTHAHAHRHWNNLKIARC